VAGAGVTRPGCPLGGDVVAADHHRAAAIQQRMAIGEAFERCPFTFSRGVQAQPQAVAGLSTRPPPRSGAGQFRRAPSARANRPTGAADGVVRACPVHGPARLAGPRSRGGGPDPTPGRRAPGGQAQSDRCRAECQRPAQGLANVPGSRGHREAPRRRVGDVWPVGIVRVRPRPGRCGSWGSSCNGLWSPGRIGRQTICPGRDAGSGRLVSPLPGEVASSQSPRDPPQRWKPASALPPTAASRHRAGAGWRRAGSGEERALTLTARMARLQHLQACDRRPGWQSRSAAAKPRAPPAPERRICLMMSLRILLRAAPHGRGAHVA